MVASPPPTIADKTLGVALYLRGKAYMNNSHSNAAMHDLLAAIKLHPELLPAQIELARAYLNCWRNVDAVNHFRKAFEANPQLKEVWKNDYVEALSRWGRTLSNSTDHSQVIAVYQEALELDPQLSNASQKLADAFISRGCAYDKKCNYALAANDFEAALNVLPGYALAYRNRGLMYQQLHRYSAAITDFTEALRLEPSVHKVYRWRAQCHRERKEFDQALADITEAERFDPSSGAILVDLGYIRECMGEEDRAYEAYDKATRIDAKYARGPYNRAGIHLKRKHYEEALLDLELAEKLDSNDKDRDITWRKSEVLLDMKRYDDALAAIDKAIRISPKHAPLHNKRGRILESMGKLPQAIVAFDEAQVCDITNSWVWYYRAGVLAKQGKLEAATRDITEAIRLSPAQSWYFARKASIDWREKRHEDAITNIERAIGLAPSEASFISDRGWYRYYHGNKEEAWKDFEESARLDSQSAAVRFNWADALLSENLFEAALEQINEALKTNHHDGDYPFLQARALRKLKRYPEALVAVNMAMERTPTNSMKYLAVRARINYELKQYAEAKADFEARVKPTSKDAEAINLLAWFLATCADASFRDGPRALRLAQKAARLTQRKAAYIVDTLAAAYAVVGRFKEAVRAEEEALVLLNGSPDPDGYGQRLESYRRKQAHVQY